MKKLSLAFVASMVLGVSSLYAEGAQVLSLAVKTYSTQYQSCAKDGQYDYIQNSSNVTYNAQSGHYVTNSCHTGNDGHTVTMVIGTGAINGEPIVGTAAGDGHLVKTEAGTLNNGLTYKLYYHTYNKYPNGVISGVFKSFYNTPGDVLASMDRFLRYP